MPWRGPEYEGEFPSLGWGVAQLASAYLQVPSGPRFGERLELTDEQISFLVRLYRLDPDTGQSVYRRGAHVKPKGWGKSPELAVFAFGELVGPIVFDGWDAYGEPIGRPRETPWVQIAALSEDQTDNTYISLLSMLEGGDAATDFGLDVGLTRIHVKGKRGARLEPVTAAAGSREGQPVTAAVLDEPHLWTPSNGGVRLAATLRRNVAKTNGKSVESTNAWKVGQGSVAEETAKAAKKGAAGLLFDHVQAPFVEDLADKELLKRSLRAVYGDAEWVDLDRLVEECNDPGTTPEDARRFFLNIPAPADGGESWLPAGAWAKCESDVSIPDGARVTVGVDVALYHDNTAVTVVHQSDDGAFVVRARTWEPDGGKIDITDVMAHIRELSFRYDVAGVAYDPRFFDVPASMLEDEGVPMVEVPQSHARMVPACGFAFEQIVAGNVRHDGDPVLTSHVLAAARRSSEGGWTLSKGKSRQVIDACIAMVIAMWESQQSESVPEPFAIYV
jgi:hypothetical protein